jgi:hypothetical protein
MITAAEAESIARKHMELANHSIGLRFEFLRVRRDVRDLEMWAVIFQYYNESGGPIDGPVIVRVDVETGQASFMR